MPGVKMLDVNRVELARSVGIEWQSDSMEPLVPSVLERFASSPAADQCSKS